MNYRTLIALCLTLSLLVIVPDHIFIGVRGAATRETGYTKVNVTVAGEMIGSNDALVILDVQEYGDYIMHHIRNAYSIPLSDLERRITEIDPNMKILVYGKGGYGGTVGGETLVENGYENVYAMCCGINGWQEIGYPVYTRYPSVQSAIDGTPEGGSVFLSSGTYREEIILNRSVSLVGENRTTTIIDPGGEGDCINVTSDNNSISDLWLSGSFSGIKQYHTENNNIIDCIFSGVAVGVSLESCTGIVLMGNTMSDCGVMLTGEQVEHWNTHTMDGTNLINGKPLLYLKDGNGTEIPENPAQIILANCTNVSIDGKHLGSASVGIALGFSSHNQISGNVALSNSLTGISLFSSKNNSIYNNTVDANRGEGITLEFSRNNVISKNLVRDNGLYGVDMRDSENNLVFNNTFFRNNEGNVQGADNTGGNRWDDGKSGNYWSDYAARFPEASNDSVRWSIPYPMDGHPNNSDEKPLIWPTFGSINHPIADAGPDVFTRQHREIIFNGTMSFDRDDIVNFTWSFLYDGSMVHLYGPSPFFIFHSAGSYTVFLNVTNTVGNNESDTLKIYVKDIEKPVSNAGENITFDQYQAAYFDAKGSTDNVNIKEYRWSFHHNGSAIALYGRSQQFVFEIPGEYLIILNISDEEGNWDIDTLTVTVHDISPPQADAGKDVTVVQDTFHLFDGSGSYDNVHIVNYTWLLSTPGKNLTFYGINFTHHFRDPGRFPATLRVRDAVGNIGTDTINITVKDVTPPKAVAGENTTTYQHRTITFDGADSSDNDGIVNYSWRFSYGGRNITLYGVSPSFTFDKAGKYMVELKIKDASGNQDVDYITVDVLEEERDVNLKGCLYAFLILLAIILMGIGVWSFYRRNGGGSNQSSKNVEPEEGTNDTAEDVEGAIEKRSTD